MGCPVIYPEDKVEIGRLGLFGPKLYDSVLVPISVGASQRPEYALLAYSYREGEWK